MPEEKCRLTKSIADNVRDGGTADEDSPFEAEELLYSLFGGFMRYQAVQQEHGEHLGAACFAKRCA